MGKPLLLIPNVSPSDSHIICTCTWMTRKYQILLINCVNKNSYRKWQIVEGVQACMIITDHTFHRNFISNNSIFIFHSEVNSCFQNKQTNKQKAIESLFYICSSISKQALPVISCIQFHPMKTKMYGGRTLTHASGLRMEQ